MRGHSVNGIAIVLAIAAFSCTASAKVWYVTVAGSGDAPTIQSAINAASTGDTVLLAAGTYTWTAQGGDHVGLPGPSMVNMRSGVTLRSESGPAVTILDAEGNGRVIRCEATANVRIDGFTIQGGSALDPQGIGPGPFSVGWGGGILCRYGSSVVISNNVVRNNRSRYNGGGLGMIGADAAIRGNVICWNRGQFRGGGVDVAGGTVEVGGNTIASNLGGGVAFVVAGGTFSENLLLNNTGGYGLWCGDATVTLVCNDFWGNPLGVYGCDTGSGNIFADPLVCATSPDYQLRPDSPCLSKNNSCNLLIGARGVGCTATDSEGIPGRDVLALGVTPNPAQGQSTISYSVPRHARSARLMVYDLRGRVVAQIPAGDHVATGSVVWDGRDQSGAAVSAGVYIVRLQTDRGAAVEKLVIMR